MSEKIYTYLLRLYPRHFREKYGEAALQLFHDRSRDETGPRLRLRLWIDLLSDLTISVLREHHRAPDPLACALAEARQLGIPAFYVFGYKAPRLGSLILAGLLSLVTFDLITLSIGHRGGSGSSRVSLLTSRGQESVYSAALSPFSRNFTHNAKATGSAADGGNLDVAERQRVMDALIKNVKQYYFDPVMAQQIAEALLTHEKRGDYDAVVDGEAFADILTRQIRDVSHDMHLEVVYSEEMLPDGPREPTPEMRARERRELEQNNCAFEQVKVFQHNIGYVKLNAFPDVSICQSRATAAMSSLNHVDAIIFDLRDNGGGSGDMVSLIASYLFDHPEFLYSPRSNPTVRSWTQPRSGNRLADKPVYVLTSASTISAAEQFTYDLKMLKRITVVGETTHGSAHAGVFYRIDAHFGVAIPKLKPINPFSKTDWEGTGVAPDVKVKAADALAAAERLAERVPTNAQ